MPNIKAQAVLVCGIPGSGKTTFCKWLKQEKGFLHLDFDRLLAGTGELEELALVAMLRENPDTFASALSSRQGSTVIDWGFPLTSLSVVQRLKEKGIGIWWFDGNRVASRISFTRRGDVGMKAFRTQMDSIDREWEQVKKLVGSNIIEAITVGPNYTAPELIFDQIFGNDP